MGRGSPLSRNSARQRRLDGIARIILFCYLRFKYSFLKKEQRMKLFLFGLILCFVIVFTTNAIASENDKASLSFQTGRSSSETLSGSNFGANFDMKPFSKDQPFYVGASVLFSKPQNENVVLGGYFFQSSNTSFFVDFNVGLRPNSFLNKRLVPSVEAGIGLSGINTSLCSADLGGCYSATDKSFSKHFGVGLRSYFGKSKKVFFGGKANFYKVSNESLRVILGEVGLAF